MGLHSQPRGGQKGHPFRVLFSPGGDQVSFSNCYPEEDLNLHSGVGLGKVKGEAQPPI
jgi:hypothetical protein